MNQQEKPPHVFDYPITIREQHIDTLGHMNNATYLELFEEARWELITANGYGMKEMLQNKKGPVILEINIKFKKEIANREKIVIRTSSLGYQGKIGKLKQWMVKENGDEACVAEFTFGFFDLKARKLIDPIPEWLKATGNG
jgi:YbgC/YbaW family acyl-CoA thioester hydrolase